MAPSRRYQQEIIKFAITSILIISFIATSSKSSDEVRSSSNKFKGRKLMVLGSRPPTCVNKCLSCKPCLATLVVHTHNQVTGIISENEITSNDYGGNNHDSYYLLSWKCKCGNKFFQP